MLCQTLQQQSQDVVNVIYLIETTKSLIQTLSENDREILFTGVNTFYEKDDIEILDLDNFCSTTKFGHSRLQQGQVTIEHYFRVENIFYCHLSTITRVE